VDAGEGRTAPAPPWREGDVILAWGDRPLTAREAAVLNEGGGDVSGFGKYAAPQLRVHLREADGEIWASTQVQHSNSQDAPRECRAADIDEALEFIRESWGLSAPGRDEGTQEADGIIAGPGPAVTVQWPGFQEHRRYLELRFGTPEETDAYETWLKSGAAHRAFGKWTTGEGKSDAS